MPVPEASITMGQILALVGRLDDTVGGDTARERFRSFLKENVREVSQIRDYVEECLRESGEQRSRALQDLVNHLGSFLGFEVEFGRYQGIQGAVGFDGHWKSPSGLHVVVEVKTTEAYAVKTASLVGYIDALISQQGIPNWEHALGLYVVGRPDPQIKGLENAIVAERRTHQLRIASVESLLSLAEMMAEYDVAHEDILAVIQPSGPALDPIVELMARLAALTGVGTVPGAAEVSEAPSGGEIGKAPNGEPTYWLTPVKGDKAASAEDTVQTLVGESGVYAYGDRTPGRRMLKPGDWICFYATGKGVIGHAKVASKPAKERHPGVREPKRYPWVFRLENVQLYLESPVILDAALRAELDGFRGRPQGRTWSWFVQATRRVSAEDFERLTRGAG